jgi:hypothetical protein
MPLNTQKEEKRGERHANRKIPQAPLPTLSSLLRLLLDGPHAQLPLHRLNIFIATSSIDGKDHCVINSVNAKKDRLT